MGQIGKTVKIIKVPEPVVAPVFKPPIRQPVPAPDIKIPVKVSIRSGWVV